MDIKYDDLLKEIILIEKEVFKNEDLNNFINYYSFIKKNEILFINIYNSLNETNDKKIIKFKNKIINKISKKLNFTVFSIIKSEEELINFLTTIIILKTFSKQSIYDNKNDGNFQHLYTTRNNIANQFEQVLIFLEIRLNFKNEVNFDEIADFIINILYYFIYKKTIKRDFFYTNKKKNSFIYIENINYNSSVILCHSKHEVYNRKENTYLYSNHFSFVNKIFKQNIKSTYVFETNIRSKFFENIINNPFYIDRKQLDSIYEELLKENNYDSLKLEEEYLILKENYINFIKKKDINSYSLIAKKLSKIQNLLRIKNILKLDFDNKKIYMPFSIDFRGRFYYDSEISISYYKEFRFCVNLGKYEKIEQNFHPINATINDEIKKYFNLLKNLNNYNFIIKKEEVKIAIIWLLISLGEINKTKLGKEVHIVKFINEGIKIINGQIEIQKLDVYDRIKVKYIQNIFDEIKEDVYIKWLISKDATASVYQHLIKVCGYNNEDSLKWCNLKSTDTWYDTYEYILDKFKQNNKIETHLINLFNRTTLKKVMMTENYSATYATCKNYFLEKIKIQEYNDEDKNKILDHFSNFYKYISDDKGMFKLKSKEILNYFKENNYVIYLNNESKDMIILRYYKGSIKQREIIREQIRFTYQKFSVVIGELDNRKIRSSIKANYVHTIDAALARWVIEQAKIKAVHDCFFIDYLNLTYVVSIVNEGMRKDFHYIWNITGDRNFFSIFIII